MRDSDSEVVAQLQTCLGYHFKVPDRALTALTHRSWLNEHPDARREDNERLEFLGDAVIDLAVSQALMEELPDAGEGRLSQLRATLVNAETLAEVAAELELGELLRLGRGEERTGGRTKTSLLSNCLEAVVGAVFVDEGLEPIRRLVDRMLIPRISDISLAPWTGRDYKTRAQERAQLVLGSTPGYRVVEESGPEHEKTFEVEMLVDGNVLGRGIGRTKKEAEQHAAKEALTLLDQEGAEPPPGRRQGPNDGEDAQPEPDGRG